jgi:hypothetical protein
MAVELPNYNFAFRATLATILLVAAAIRQSGPSSEAKRIRLNFVMGVSIRVAPKGCKILNILRPTSRRTLQGEG